MRPRRSPARPSGRPLLAAALLLFAGRCGPGAMPATCPFQSPVCPDPQPSYGGQVGAIIQTFCVGCHGPGGQESVMPFATLDDIKMHMYAGPMQRQLLSCLMPPADQPQLSADQKTALIGWLTCGAPDN